MPISIIPIAPPIRWSPVFYQSSNFLCFRRSSCCGIAVMTSVNKLIHAIDIKYAKPCVIRNSYRWYLLPTSAFINEIYTHWLPSCSCTSRHPKANYSLVPAFRRDNPINVKEPAKLFRLASSVLLMAKEYCRYFIV